YFITYLTSIDNLNSKLKQGMSRSSIIHSTPLMIMRMIGALTFYLVTLIGLAVTIKLLKQWWLKQKETEQLSKEKISAELQLLKAQIHPHFLFNSLNNIYSFALETSPKAPEMINKLSGLLHYMLYDCKLQLVPLEKELKMIQDYISLEKIRYGERLDLEVTIQEISPALAGETGTKYIAPLLLIPFVENSFKHGTSKMLANPKVTLNIKIKDNILFFKLTNSKPTAIVKISSNNNSGLGLKNVQKRLELIYPGRHELQIVEDPSEFSVWLKVILVENEAQKKKTLIKKEIAVYDELA
ncbi:MAG: histidine kinase, partial [Chitinophagaceae bacterium]